MIVHGPRQGLLLHTNIKPGSGVVAAIENLRRRLHKETGKEAHTMRIGPELERDLNDELQFLRLHGPRVNGKLVTFAGMSIIVDPERAPRGIVLEASR